MSYSTFFSFSTGFSRTLRVKKGTHQRILDRIDYTEKTLGLQRTPTYTPEGEKQNPGWHWTNPKSDMRKTAGEKTDMSLPEWYLANREREKRIETMATAVRLHNQDIIRLYNDIEECQDKKWKRGESERITAAQSIEFWGGLQILDLPRELWTRDHFTDHMEHLYELLTTGNSRGVYLDYKPFNRKQASALLKLFEDEIDQWGFDMRFEIPLDENLKPYDRIAASYDGGYDWCSHCGPIHTDDFYRRCRICPRAKKGQCDLKNSHPAEFDDED